jgi:hypothetical protein
LVQRADFARPNVSSGDASAGDVFCSVGFALSRWEQAEEMFASLFAFLVSPTRSTHSAFRAYGTLTATASRKNMIEAAAAVYLVNFPEANLERRLKDLLTIYMDAGARRNEIAHGIVRGPVDQTGKTEWFLSPALHSSKKRNVNLQPEYRYNAAIIESFGKSFEGLLSDVSSLRQDFDTHFQSLPLAQRDQY